MHREYRIKPKKTRYNKILFRSALEARWAVFFDYLGLEYIYEPHCEEVETGGREVTYKPDFLLPILDIYVEIKPSKPTGIENTKAAAWSKYLGDIIVLFNLNVPTEKLENGWKFTTDDFHKPPVLSTTFNWCECPKCGYVDIAEFGLITVCGCFSDDDHDRMYDTLQDKGYELSPNFERTHRLKTAYKRAKNHNFKKNGGWLKVNKLSIQLSLI